MAYSDTIRLRFSGNRFRFSPTIRDDAAALMRLDSLRARPNAPAVSPDVGLTVLWRSCAGPVSARDAISYGYVGVVLTAAGKRLSTDEIPSYETEVDDTHAVID
ncbi:hypothetical protein BH24GEM3_BH24GEM3_18580 [soil metagenome]